MYLTAALNGIGCGIIAAVMMSLGCGVTTWQFWTVLAVSFAMYVNGVLDRW